jgi:hypothetical protein
MIEMCYVLDLAEPDLNSLIDVHHLYCDFLVATESIRLCHERGILVVMMNQLWFRNATATSNCSGIIVLLTSTCRIILSHLLLLNLLLKLNLMMILMI